MIIKIIDITGTTMAAIKLMELLFESLLELFEEFS